GRVPGRRQGRRTPRVARGARGRRGGSVRGHARAGRRPAAAERAHVPARRRARGREQLTAPPVTARETRRGEYEISTDRARVPVAEVHRWLCDESYWAKGIPLDVVQTSILNSLNFGVYHGAALVGFARVITDYATFAYVGDVFVVGAHRGRGLSKWL